MAHDHHHHESDTYFIDQISMVGLSGAFGVICLCLYFVQTWMLNLLLGEQFHLMVAVSGFVLLTLAVVRAVGLWNEAKPAHTHDHDHHAEDCGHDHHHGVCDHDHSHHHAHEHDHAHGHTHSHEHHNDDHDHGWAPWRYVVMLVPIILFLLGLPNKGPAAADVDDVAARTAESVRASIETVALVAADPWSRLGAIGKLAGDDDLGSAIPAGFKKLYDSVGDENERRFFEGKIVKLRGQFSPYPSDPRFFALVRFQIGCCAGDAVDKRIAVFSREPIANVKRNDWAEVVGKVEYAKRGENYIMRLATNGPANVQSKPADPDPYFK